MIKQAIVVIGVLTASSAGAADLVVKTSPHSVDVTVDRLQNAVTTAGATVFARIDHAAGAEKIGSELTPTQVLIFGNPKLGTPVIAADGASGLDLPMRVVVFTGPDGATQLAYHAPGRLVEDHDVPANLPAINMMTGALDKLTNAAVAQ